MLRRASTRTALVAGLALACGDGGAAVPPPPRPENLASFDPRAVSRIEGALAKLEDSPRQGTAWAELGLVYASERLKSLALECFAVAERLEPKQPKWPYRSGVTLAQIGSFEEAARAFQRSLALEPDYPPSHARQGECWLALGSLERAEPAFRRATELDSSYPGGWIGLAKVALQRDQADAAVAILERLVAQDPDDRTFRQLLANAERQEGVGGELTSASVLAAEDVPVWNDPWELEARAFRQRPTMLEAARMLEHGQASEALALLEAERARGVDPGANALLMAQALARLERKPAALREAERAVAREPENVTALFLQADLLDDTGQEEEALAVLEHVTALRPSDGGAFAAKGRKLAQHGYHEAASLALSRALELGVSDFELRFTLAQCWIVLKRWSEARELLTALVRERPEHGDAWVELAIARQKTGALDEAGQALEKARATGSASAQLLADVERALEAARARRARKEAGGGEGVE
jgi:tetratricopeptide (TPR) repeat protein